MSGFLFGAVLKARISFERARILKASSLETTDCGMSGRSLDPSRHCVRTRRVRPGLSFISQVLVLLKVDIFVMVWVWNVPCRLELLWGYRSWVPGGDWSWGLSFWWSHNFTEVGRQWEPKAGSGWRELVVVACPDRVCLSPSLFSLVPVCHLWVHLL